MFFVMMAVLSLAFVSCSSDDDNEDKEDKENNINSGNSSIKQDLYQFFYNGKQYTYGGYVAKVNGIYSRAYFSDMGDNEYFLRIKAYLISSEYSEDAYGYRYYKYDESIECSFELKDLNIETVSKGDVVGFKQAISTGLGWDLYNYILYGSNGREPGVRYSWTGDAVGSIKFVSYEENNRGDKILVLDFQNVSMHRIAQGNYAEQATINGEVMFIDNVAGVLIDFDR